MKITLLTVGKTDVRWVREGLELYVSRLSHYVRFALKEIPELKNVSAFTKEQIKEKEGELILSSLTPGDFVVLREGAEIPFGGVRGLHQGEAQQGSGYGFRGWRGLRIPAEGVFQG